MIEQIVDYSTYYFNIKAKFMRNISFDSGICSELPL